MRVLAIDPGYDRAGLAIIEKEEVGKESLLFSTCVETDKKLPIYKRIFFILEEIEKTLETYQPDSLAIEKLFFNKNIKTAIAVAETRGAIIYLAQKYHCEIFEFSPQEIKVATTGWGNSDKKAVIDMVKRLIDNPPEKALDDEYDAIAIGITCLATKVNRRQNFDLVEE